MILLQLHILEEDFRCSGTRPPEFVLWSLIYHLLELSLSCGQLLNLLIQFGDFLFERLKLRHFLAIVSLLVLQFLGFVDLGLESSNLLLRLFMSLLQNLQVIGQIDVLFLQCWHIYLLFLDEWQLMRVMDSRQRSARGTFLIKYLLQLGVEVALDLSRLVVDCVQDSEDLLTFEAWDALEHVQEADVRKD